MPRRPPGKLNAAARALYHRIPGEAELAQSGFSAEDYMLDDVELWPENWKVFQIFSCMRSQWLSGVGGPTGLAYQSLYPLLDREAETRDEWDELFDDIRAMEATALEAIHAKT